MGTYELGSIRHNLFHDSSSPFEIIQVIIWMWRQVIVHPFVVITDWLTLAHFRQDWGEVILVHVRRWIDRILKHIKHTCLLLQTVPIWGAPCTVQISNIFHIIILASVSDVHAVFVSNFATSIIELPFKRWWIKIEMEFLLYSTFDKDLILAITCCHLLSINVLSIW